MKISLGSIDSIRIEKPVQCSDCTQCLPYAADDGDGETHCTQDRCKKWETPVKIVLYQKGDLDENVIIVECWPYSYLPDGLPIEVVDPS